MWKEWEMTNWQREQMPRKWREKGGEEDRKCDGRTALIEENGEQQKDRESWRLLTDNVEI